MAAQSARLTRAEAHHQSDIGELLSLTLRSDADAASAADAHRAIVEAIRSRDTAEAKALAVEHTQREAEKLIELHLDLTSRSEMR